MPGGAAPIDTCLHVDDDPPRAPAGHSTGAQGDSNDSTLVRRSTLSGGAGAMETIACPDCDLLQRIPPLPLGGKARCARCSKTLATRRSDTLDRTLALTIAAA